MAKKPDTQQQLETIIGQQLNEHTVDTFQVFQVVASSNRSDAFITRRSFIVARPNQCSSGSVLDVYGLWQTGDDGTTTFRLSSFICPTNEKYVLPINVVATPLATAPRFLTVRRSLLNNGGDVEIQVSTWNPNGTPAPNVVFDWRCRAQLEVVIL
jgi:hypothetical protein